MFLHSPPSLPQSMVGSDVAELLMQDRRCQEKYKRQNPMENPISLAEDEWRQPGTLDLITGEVPPVVETQAQIVEKFTKLLYYGRKKVSCEQDLACRGDFFVGPVVLSRQVLRVVRILVQDPEPCGCRIGSSSCVCTIVVIVVEVRKLNKAL